MPVDSQTQTKEIQNVPQNEAILEQNDITKITITLPTNAYFMSGVRDFTLSLIKNMTDFTEQWAYRFQSVVDELCNNAIEHGSNKTQEIKIIFITQARKYVQIMVEDSGTGSKQINASALEALVNERRTEGYAKIGIRGRGLAKIVAEWTDELKFEDIQGGGIRVIVKKYLNNTSQNYNLSQGIQKLNTDKPENIQKIVLET